MNIFAIEGDKLNIDWRRSAYSHDDYRCNKMIIESCQMLCTTARLYGEETRYKKSFENHPMTKWVGESFWNFSNVVTLAQSLKWAFESRHNKTTHGCDDVISHMHTLIRGKFYKKFPIIDHNTNMPLCMPHEYKIDGNTVESYRNYFANKPNLRYYHTPPPDWLAKYRSPQLPPIQTK